MGPNIRNTTAARAPALAALQEWEGFVAINTGRRHWVVDPLLLPFLLPHPWRLCCVCGLTLPFPQCVRCVLVPLIRAPLSTISGVVYSASRCMLCTCRTRRIHLLCTCTTRRIHRVTQEGVKHWGSFFFFFFRSWSEITGAWSSTRDTVCNRLVNFCHCVRGVPP